MIALPHETAAPLASALVRAGRAGRSRRVAISNGAAPGSVISLLDRRAFLATLGGGLLAAPLVAGGQQSDRVRRIGVLMGFSENDEVWQAYLAAFRRRLQELGWTVGRNIQIDYRFAGENTERTRTGAGELIAIAPDVILVSTNPAVSAVMRATRTIPIVFTYVSDSVGSGFVASLARPGGHVTGFHNFEPAISGKWLEVLRQIAPGVRRVAVVHVPDIAANVALLHAVEAASTSGITVTGAGVRTAADIEPALTAFARLPNGGLIIAPSPLTTTRRDLIIASAARRSLPAVYPFRFFCESGGLASYGIDHMEQVREAASYVDRILHGAKPGELPVQLPTKFELVVNAKTAKALGLTIPPSFLQRADQVIE